MQTEIQTTVFNYEILDCKDVDRVFLKGKEEVIKSRTAQTVIENGRDLMEAKERVGHGNFMKWVEGAFPWNYKTAQRMMYVAESFKMDTGVHFENFQTKALYALSAPSTPEAARAEALELAEAGEKITHRQAQELIKAHKDIEAKNQQLADMHAQIKKLEIRLPTDETVAEINRLKSELDKLKKNPVEVEVKPKDYDTIKKERLDLEIERRTLQDKLKNMKIDHRKALQEKEETLKNQIQEGIEKKQKQVDALNSTIQNLTDKMNTLEGQVNAVSATKESITQIRHNLYNISIVLSDLFSDYAVPEELKKDLMFLANEMADGSKQFRDYLSGNNKTETAKKELT